MTIEYMIADGDGLKRHQPVVFEQSTAGLKKGVIKMVTDGFDHLNGDQPVKFTLEIAVVFLQ